MTRRDRRRAARRIPGPDEALSRIRLRAGRELAVINVSCRGALVEGEVRLLPGTHTDVHVLTATGRVVVRSRVVRAYVTALSSNRITYRGALAFEHPVDVDLVSGMPAPINHDGDHDRRHRKSHHH
jgi:hypothetical protein